MLAIWPWPAIMIGLHETMFTEDDYRCFTSNLQPGDFIITKSEPFFLSNRAISKTAFKHLAVYVGAVEGRKEREHGFIQKPKGLGVGYEHTGKAPSGTFERCVVHAISDGVVCQDVLRLFSHCDYAAAVRAWSTKAEQEAIVNAAIGRVGLPYNFDFSPKGPEALYCTELGVYCCKKAEIKPPDTRKMTISLWGKKGEVTVADSYLKFPMVCCSVSCEDNKFYSSSYLGDAMRVAIMGTSSANS